jgi:hypothetical protein
MGPFSSGAGVGSLLAAPLAVTRRGRALTFEFVVRFGVSGRFVFIGPLG